MNTKALRALGESLEHTTVHLDLANLPDRQPSRPGQFYLSFSRRDIDALCDALEARDARIKELEAHNEV